MIDDIVEMILVEASGRPGDDRVSVIYRVMREIEEAVTIVMENALEIERRKKEDENKR